MPTRASKEPFIVGSTLLEFSLSGRSWLIIYNLLYTTVIINGYYVGVFYIM